MAKVTDMAMGQLALDNHLYSDCSQGKLIVKLSRDWRDSPKARSTGCSCRGLEFHSPNPHSGSQPPKTPVTKDPIPSSDLPGHQAYMWYIHTDTDKTLLPVHFFKKLN